MENLFLIEFAAIKQDRHDGRRLSTFCHAFVLNGVAKLSRIYCSRRTKCNSEPLLCNAKVYQATVGKMKCQCCCCCKELLCNVYANEQIKMILVLVIFRFVLMNFIDIKMMMMFPFHSSFDAPSFSNIANEFDLAFFFCSLLFDIRLQLCKSCSLSVVVEFIRSWVEN